MRALPLVLLGLAGCVVVDPHAASAAGAPPRSTSAPLTQDEAVQAAFRVAAERRLEVDRVQHAHLDLQERWHVDLVGPRDRAQVVIDGRDGRFLQGRFRAGDGSAGPAQPPAAEAVPGAATAALPAPREPPAKAPAPPAPTAPQAPAPPQPPAAPAAPAAPQPPAAAAPPPPAEPPPSPAPPAAPPAQNPAP